MTEQNQKIETGRDNDFFEPYSYYSKTLRTWLVAYGIGGPAVLITHPEALKTISDNGGHVAIIGWLFLAGVTAQIFLAFLNKIIMWNIYFAETHPRLKKTCKYTLCNCLSEQFWIDIVIDLFSLFTIGTATVLLFQAFTKLHR